MTKVTMTKCKYCGAEQVNANLKCMSCGEINLLPECQERIDMANKIKRISTRSLDLFGPTFRNELNEKYNSYENERYRKSKEGEPYVVKLAKSLEPLMLFENAFNQKFRIEEVSDTFVIFGRLTKDGIKIEPNSLRKYSRNVLARLLINKYFAKTRVARRELFPELKAVGAFDLMKK